jgi:hypothetical protein
MRKSVTDLSKRRGGEARRGGGAGAGLALLLAGCSAAAPARAPLDPPATIAPESIAPAIDRLDDDAIVVVTTAAPPSDLLLDPPQADLSSIPERDSEGRFAFERLTIDAEWIPAMWVTLDVEQNGNTATRGDLDNGSGVLLRAGMGTTSQNIGVLYMGTWHDEKTTGRGASTQSLLLDFLYRAPIPETGGAVWFEADAGVGGTEIQFDSDQLDDQLTGSALLHGDLEFRVTRAFTIAAGLGVFIWGHPGDTAAYGSYLTLGAKLIF